MKLDAQHRDCIEAAMREMVATMNEESARLPGHDKEIEIEFSLGRVPSLRTGNKPVAALRQNLATKLPFAVGLSLSPVFVS